MNLRFLPGKEIPSDTALWRYMSFGAFFLLLKRNEVFVPSLRKLQEDDPKEMCVPLDSDTDIDKLRRSAVFCEAQEWLETKLLCRTGSDRHPDTDCKERRFEDVRLIEEFIRQLGVRRLAWCWFSPGRPPSDWCESMAMWSLYARNGVLIKTTYKNITAALGDQDLTEPLVAEVEYRTPRAPNTLPSDQFQEYTKRPFLVKSASYRHEHEVRMVFQVNAGVPASGFKVKVDAERLLKGGEVIVSPFVVPDEQRAVIELAEGLLPKGTAALRPSTERAPDPDSYHLSDANDEIERLSEPFSVEPGLPGLLREL